MELNIEEILSQLPPEELERIDRDQLEATRMELEYRATKKPEQFTSMITEVAADLSTENLEELIKTLQAKSRAAKNVARRSKSKPEKPE